MTRPFDVPGPLGLSPGVNGARLPDPFRVGPGTQAAPQQLARAVKTLKMPPPVTDGQNTSKFVRDVHWDLFARGIPAVDDVAQGRIAFCVLGAVLAAQAHTPDGRKHILGLIQKLDAIVETDLAAIAGKLDETPSGNAITSTRYFTVKLGGKTFEVSSVLYTDEAAEPNPLYMSSPTMVLWPCVIEKAYAEKEGGYGALERRTAHAVWEAVVGAKPLGFPVTGATTDAQLRQAAQYASRIPTVAASSEDAFDLTDWQGVAVLGMKGPRIELYDAMKAKRETVTLEMFRQNFQAVLHA